MHRTRGPFKVHYWKFLSIILTWSFDTRSGKFQGYKSDSFTGKQRWPRSASRRIVVNEVVVEQFVEIYNDRLNQTHGSEGISSNYQESILPRDY